MGDNYLTQVEKRTLKYSCGTYLDKVADKRIQRAQHNTGKTLRALCKQVTNDPTRARDYHVRVITHMGTTYTDVQPHKLEGDRFVGRRYAGKVEHIAQQGHAGELGSFSIGNVREIVVAKKSDWITRR